MNVRELIAKLQKYDQDMDVVIHPFLDRSDIENGIYNAEDVLEDDVAPITLCTLDVQSTYASFEGDEFEDDDEDDCVEVLCDYCSFKDPIKSKKVLMISSPEFAQGVVVEEEEFRFTKE